MRRPGGPGGGGTNFARGPLSAALPLRCFRSASCRPARPSTTSSRARCALTRSRASATALEEYYAGGAEARGTWIGSGGASLGLSGPVDGDALRRVLAGLDPQDGSPLRSSSSAVKVAGFDLTFSAPKSVSVLFGIGDASCVPRSATRTTAPSSRRSAIWSVRRRRSVAAMAGLRSCRRRGWWRRRFGIARRARAIRSCTPTSWSPTSAADRTAAGRRSMAGGCTRTRGRRASSTRPSCAPSSRGRSGSSGCRSATGSPSSSASRSRCCGRSAAGARRSRRRWPSAGRRARARPRPRRWRPGRPSAATLTIDELVAGLAGPRGRARPRPRQARAAARPRPAPRRSTMRCGSGSSPSSPRRPGSRSGRRRSRAATSSRRCASGSRPARWSTRARSRRRPTGSSPHRTPSRCCPRAGRARRIGAATGGCCRSNATSSSTRPRSCSRSSSGSSARSAPHTTRGAGVDRRDGRCGLRSRRGRRSRPSSG